MGQTPTLLIVRDKELNSRTDSTIYIHALFFIISSSFEYTTFRFSRFVSYFVKRITLGSRVLMYDTTQPTTPLHHDTIHHHTITSNHTTHCNTLQSYHTPHWQHNTVHHTEPHNTTQPHHRMIPQNTTHPSTLQRKVNLTANK